MKKLLYSLAAVATLLFAASCAQENLGRPAGEDTVEATFSVALPDAVGTKAISDGTAATELLFFAFDGNGKYLANVKPAEAVTVNNYEASVTVKLIKGMTYNFVFWAQKPGKYTSLISATNGEVGAKLDISSVAAAMMNDDSFDAFYGRISNYKVEKAFSTEQLILTRPFAQVNVGAYAEDIAAAQASNLETGADVLKTKYFLGTEGKLKVNTTLDLLSGAAAGESEIDLTAALRPNETLTVDGTDYTWVAMLYLLQTAPDYYDSNLAFVNDDENKATLAELDFNIATTQNGDAVNTDRNVYNVPVQRNYRTNILGNIFSVDGTFNIKVDQNFQKIDAAEYLPEYADIAALNAAFAKADATDADKWSYKVKVLAPGSDTKIVLPNTTDPVDIVLADGAWADAEIEIAYAEGTGVAKPTKLTLKVDELKGLTANITSTHFELVAGSHVVNAEVATSNTTFVIQKTASVDNLKINAGGLVIEEGATVENISVDINADVTLPEALAEKVEYFGEVASQTALTKALAGGGEFTVAADIVTDAQLVVPAGKTVVLDMDGKILSNTEDIWSGANWSLISVQGGELTIKGNGKFLAKENDEYAVDVRDGGKLVVEDGEFAGNVTAIYAYEGNVEINGGTFYIQQLANNVTTDKYRYTLNCLDASWKSGKSVFTVTGGTFKEFDPSAHQAEPSSPNSFVPAGYITTSEVIEGATWYTVVEGAREAPEFLVDKTELSLFVGGTGELALTNGSDGALTVKSDKEDVATVALVEGKYVVTAVAAGTANITFAVAQSNTYEAAEATVKVTVAAVEFENIFFSKQPEKVEFAYGEEFSFDGEVKAKYNNGNEIPVAVNELSITGYSATTPGEQEITVSYNSFPITYKVTVAEQVITYTSISELKALIPSDEATLTDVYVKDVVVTGINGKNYYIEDENAGVVFYGTYDNLAEGMKFTAKLTGLKGKTYNGLKEITAVIFEGLESSTATVTPITVTTAQLAADFETYDSRRVKVENVTVTSQIKSSGNSVEIGDGIVLRAAKALENGISANTVNNIVGYPTPYKEAKQLSIWSDDMVTFVSKIQATTSLSVEDASIAVDATSAVQIQYTVNPSDAVVKFALDEASDLIEVSETGAITIKAGATVDANTDVQVNATVVATDDYTAASDVCVVTVKPASQGGGDDTVYYVKATSISAGKYIMAYESTAFNGTVSTGSTPYGQTASIAVSDDKIESNATVDAYQVVIEASTISDGGDYVIKAGGKYLAWTSGNSLTTVDSEAKNATWNISISDGNATITNGNDTSRKPQYNSGSPRFACYTSSQKLVTLYKLSE